MTAELISVGTEILMGNILNSNAQYLAGKCAALGLNLYYQTVVGDNYERMRAVVDMALSRSDILILTGGLGPTEDDLTKKVCAEVMGSVPRGARVLDNANGMAPGLILEKEGKTAILLPGPPEELYPMFEEQVIPYLEERQQAVLVSKMVKICGHGESQIEDRLLDLIQSQTNPTIATYAKTAEVHLRLTARAGSEAEGEALLEPVLSEILRRFGDAVYTTCEAVTLEMAVAELLKESRLTMATAESCTGGMIGATMVNVPGVSEVFTQGMITYSNEAKVRLLGVREETLAAYGAVSPETAAEMAEGGAGAAGTDLCVAVTGIAGPDGGTAEKPVGLVYIACSLKGKTVVKRYQFKGNRAKIREQSMMRALDLVRRCVLEYKRDQEDRA